MLSADEFMVMNYNCMYYNSWVGIILGPAESAMSWVYCYLPMMSNYYYEAIMHFLL